MGAVHLVIVHEATRETPVGEDDAAALPDAYASPPPPPLRPSSVILAAELLKLSFSAAAVAYLFATARDAPARQTLLRQLRSGARPRRSTPRRRSVLHPRACPPRCCCGIGCTLSAAQRPPVRLPIQHQLQSTDHPHARTPPPSQ